jgi:MFS family permease
MINWRKYLKFNRIIWVLINSDLLIISATGFLAPILAVFLTKQIHGGSLAVVGFCTAIFWVSKAVVQVPVSWYVDKSDSELTTYNIMVAGSLMASVVPLLYYFFARDVWHIYLFQALDGVASALMVPTWLALFTKHIDKHREATEWAIYSNTSGIGYAIAAAVGGVLAERYGFFVIFPLVSLVMLAGTLVLLVIRHQVIVSEHRHVLKHFSGRTSHGGTA